MVISIREAEQALSQSLRPDNTTNELLKFNSAAPTLNNTPAPSNLPSRSNSPERRSVPVMDKRIFSKKDGEDHVVKEEWEISPSFVFQQLSPAWMGTVIIVCFFTSGLIDAVAFNSWNCFVGMQTGNTVFAALGIGGQPAAAHPQQYYKSLVAISSFCFGTLFFNFIHRWPTGLHKQPTARTRIIFVVSFLVQTILIIVPAALVTVGIVSNQPFIAGVFSSGSQLTREVVDTEHLPPNYRDLIPVSILAFEAAGQVCLSRVLSLIELPTIVLSTLYHDFTADTFGTWQLWRNSSSFWDFIMVQHRRQQKRLFSIIALFLGGVVGGEMYKSVAGMGGALWLAAALKACITIAFSFWRKEMPATSSSPV